MIFLLISWSIVCYKKKESYSTRRPELLPHRHHNRHRHPRRYAERNKKPGPVRNNPGNKRQEHRHPQVTGGCEQSHGGALVLPDTGEERHLGDHDDTGQEAEHEEACRGENRDNKLRRRNTMN